MFFFCGKPPPQVHFPSTLGLSRPCGFFFQGSRVWIPTPIPLSTSKVALPVPGFGEESPASAGLPSTPELRSSAATPSSRSSRRVVSCTLHFFFNLCSLFYICLYIYIYIYIYFCICYYLFVYFFLSLFVFVDLFIFVFVIIYLFISLFLSFFLSFSIFFSLFIYLFIYLIIIIIIDLFMFFSLLFVLFCLTFCLGARCHAKTAAPSWFFSFLAPGDGRLAHKFLIRAGPLTEPCPSPDDLHKSRRGAASTPREKPSAEMVRSQDMLTRAAAASSEAPNRGMKRR